MLVLNFPIARKTLVPSVLSLCWDWVASWEIVFDTLVQVWTFAFVDDKAHLAQPVPKGRKVLRRIWSDWSETFGTLNLWQTWLRAQEKTHSMATRNCFLCLRLLRVRCRWSLSWPEVEMYCDAVFARTVLYWSLNFSRQGSTVLQNRQLFGQETAPGQFCKALFWVFENWNPLV